MNLYSTFRSTLLPAAVAVVMLALLAPGPVHAQEIYRCVDEGVTIFSDTPCDDDARPHQLRAGLSVSGIGADEIERIEEANQRFLESQRERQAQAREQALAREQARPVVQFIQPGTRVYPGFFHGPGRPPFRNDEEEEQPGPSAGPRQERFSALSGRQPGARPRQDRDR